MDDDQATSRSVGWSGPIFGLVAAVLYTAANIALRDCVNVNAYLVSAVKASPTVILLGPMMVWLAGRGEPLIAGRQRWVQFICASFLAQFFGNAAFQKALGYIGLAASVPITLGVLIVGGAALGKWMLGEPVTRHKAWAMIVLIAAVVVLSLPADSEASSDGARSATDIVIGSSWAALSGLAYSFFGVTLRQLLRTGMRASTTMFVSGLIGTVTLWIYSFATMGADEIAETTSSQWITMSAAGLFNFTAFIALTASLKLLPVVAVNLINASQVAMAAVAGVVLFGERITLPLSGGIVLTIVGLLILAKRD